MFVQISPPKKFFFLYASCTDSTGCKVYSLSLWSLVISENHRTAKSILSAQVVSKIKVSELDFILQWMNIGVTWEKICRIFLFTKLIVFALFPRFLFQKKNEYRLYTAQCNNDLQLCVKTFWSITEKTQIWMTWFYFKNRKMHSNSYAKLIYSDYVAF